MEGGASYGDAISLPINLSGSFWLRYLCRMSVSRSVSFSPPPYRAPWYLPNGHWQTIVPALTRRVRDFTYQREALSTPDHDTLQLDVLAAGSSRLVVIAHGLEGDSNRPYVRGMTRAFHREGYDVLAWNFRSCGGAPNRQLRFYQSGATDDLHHLLTHWPFITRYTDIVLVGFSLGGNLTLKYLGEQGSSLLPTIRGGITFSVPLDLAACARRITHPSNRVYHRRFLRQLKQKIVRKHPTFPRDLPLEALADVRTLVDFDDRYTAPLHGFRNAQDYYEQCSSKQFLDDIAVPTLIVNAQNDPFLPQSCYLTYPPRRETAITFVAPVQGGHCGFLPRCHRPGQDYWSEQVARRFARTLSAS